MITPACNSDAGAATVLLADVGNIRVTNTPILNAASRISIRSGLLSTVLLSLHVQRGALFCTYARFLSLSGSNCYLVIISQTWTKSIPQTGQRKALKPAPFLASTGVSLAADPGKADRQGCRSPPSRDSSAARVSAQTRDAHGAPVAPRPESGHRQPRGCDSGT